MALECPVVAFDIPPVREVLGETGRLVAVGDDQGLASEIIATLEDGVAAAGRARAARERFETTYDLDQLVGQMAQLYRDVDAGVFPFPTALRVTGRRARRRRSLGSSA
jgi:glycosyltransferase involved in cell wall biosynthesis